MTMLYNRETQSHDFSTDSAYRAYLISRNDAPIVYHSGDIQWKRVCVTLRRARNRFRSAFASIHMALVADKMRRVHLDLTRTGIRKINLSTRLAAKAPK